MDFFDDLNPTFEDRGAWVDDDYIDLDEYGYPSDSPSDYFYGEVDEDEYFEDDLDVETRGRYPEDYRK